jgi:hypothetical protein
MFESGGQVAVYPGESRALASFNIPSHTLSTSHTFHCPYVIYSEHGKTINGELRLTVTAHRQGIEVVH